MHVYGVQNIVTGEVEDVHVVRLWFYANKDLEMTAALKEVFQHDFTQDEFEMFGIVDFSKAEDGQGFDVKVDWVNSTRERVHGSRLQLYGTAPRSLSSQSCGS